MTREEFLKYQFQGYPQAKALWALFYDLEAEWQRYRRIQENNARYLAAALSTKASRPGLSDEEVDLIVQREYPDIRFDLPPSDRRGHCSLFHLRLLIEEGLEKAQAVKDAAAVAEWQKAMAALQRLASPGRLRTQD